MTTTVRKWGNSLALRIPRSYAKDIHLESGAAVNISISNGRLVIEPSTRPKYALSVMLKQITKKNRPGEWDTGKPVGKEVW